MLTQNPPNILKKNPNGIAGFLIGIMNAGSAAADRFTSALDPLPVNKGPAKPKSDPHLDDRLRDALDMIAGVAPVVTTVSIPAFTPRHGMPAAPARIQVIGQLGPRMLPAALWDDLISEGWITSAGAFTDQYERVIDAELFVEG